jgi:hypothetical protein
MLVVVIVIIIISRCNNNTGQNHYVIVANKSFENIADLKYLEMTVTNQNCIHEETKNRLSAVAQAV